MIKKILILCFLFFSVCTYSQSSIESLITVSSDTDDNSEKSFSLTGWHQLTDVIGIGLSQSEYRYDNQGDKDEGYNLISKLSSDYAAQLLNVPDSVWPIARDQFISVYGVDPELASREERNAAISTVASSADINSFKEVANKSSFLIKGDMNDLGYYADVGVTTFKDSYLTGNFSINWADSNYFTYAFDFDRSLADIGYEYSASNCAVSKDFSCDPDSVAILRNTPSLSVDFSLDQYGIAAIVGRSHYSDGNDRDFLRSKWYVVASDEYGLSVYLKTRNYSNTEDRLSADEVAQDIVDDQLTMQSEDYLLGSYYSPRHYGQYSAGLGIRRKIMTGHIVSGYVEQGRQDADGVWSGAASWRLQYDAKIINTNFDFQFVAGEDSSSDSYKYKYMQIQLIYGFL